MSQEGEGNLVTPFLSSDTNAFSFCKGTSHIETARRRLAGSVEAVNCCAGWKEKLRKGQLLDWDQACCIQRGSFHFGNTACQMWLRAETSRNESRNDLRSRPLLVI